jgi:folate-binding protein YgfZ
MTETSLPANEWITFLARQPASSAAGADQQDFVAPLTDLGLIALSGDDAASFLHNQLTNDVEHLGAGEVRLAGYCTPKGRLLATMLLWKSGEFIMLALPRALQPAIQKRLQMYVLRAKARLQDISEQKAVLGLAGKQAAAALQAWFPDLPVRPYAKEENAAGALMRLADGAGATPRYQWVCDNAVAIEAWPQLRAALPAADGAAWRLGDIQAGVPQITAATQEKFVPQMINFELIGGVNFQKGCYPGQEIVARSQYLGKPKRRMALATVEGDAAGSVRPGVDIFSSEDPEQPCGMIVNAEAGDGGRMNCLAEIKLAALDAGSVHAGSANGPALRFHPLPYLLTDSR